MAMLDANDYNNIDSLSSDHGQTSKSFTMSAIPQVALSSHQVDVDFQDLQREERNLANFRLQITHSCERTFRPA